MTTIVHPFTQPRETDQAWSRPRLQNVFPPTVFELGKVLKPNLITPYNPKHTLPTPPATAPARSYDATSSALVPICDTPAHELIHKIISDRGISDASGDETAFFAADLSAIYRAVQTWRASLIGSRVEIFYAVKCNPAPPVLHLLSLLGTSFDCASAAEIAQVLSLPASPSPSRIIFANPCKPASFIRAAAEKGVSMMTFDNADELFKIKRVYPSAKLVLRILTDDSKSLCRLGLKYGAPLASCPDLLLTAAQLGLDVIGVSFHVGSGCKDPMLFADAIWRAKRVFDMAKDVGYDFKFLDIGGGFEMASFLEMSQIISDSLDLYFPVETGVRVIAEPGRLMVSNAFTLATNIIARRRAHQAVSAGPSVLPTEHDKGEGADVMYYINDGVYGSFNCILFDHQIVHPYPLTISHVSTKAQPPFPPPPNVHLPVDLSVQLGYTDAENASVWGPTCDSIDSVRQLVRLPKGLDVGDWLGWGEMGAYTLCAASTFNGFERSPVHWTTGGYSCDSIAVRATLDAFSGPCR